MSERYGDAGGKVQGIIGKFRVCGRLVSEKYRRWRAGQGYIDSGGARVRIVGKVQTPNVAVASGGRAVVGKVQAALEQKSRPRGLSFVPFRRGKRFDGQGLYFPDDGGVATFGHFEQNGRWRWGSKRLDRNGRIL